MRHCWRRYASCFLEGLLSKPKLSAFPQESLSAAERASEELRAKLSCSQEKHEAHMGMLISEYEKAIAAIASRAVDGGGAGGGNGSESGGSELEQRLRQASSECMHLCMYINHSSSHRDEHVSRRGGPPVACRHAVPPYTSAGSVVQ